MYLIELDCMTVEEFNQQANLNVTEEEIKRAIAEIVLDKKKFRCATCDQYEKAVNAVMLYMDYCETLDSDIYYFFDDIKKFFEDKE